MALKVLNIVVFDQHSISAFRYLADRQKLVACSRISIDNVGNTPEAGRTGTRIWSGRPQPRWDAGVRLAKQLINTRSRSLHGSQPLGVGSRIREAKKYLTEFFSLTSRTPG